ncbi:MAG: nucleotide exchange factor GrpE [Acidobacteria bacterium]|nr:MAG: nucleotide exchange factor GrpE [Acidobacteriota bacterium]
MRGAALQRSAEQDVKNYWHRRSEKVSEKEVKINLNVNKDDDAANVEQSADAQAVAADTAKSDAEIAKLGADLEELRQTLLRRQADFDNYRKRIEKERFEDSKRATARVIEGLIPVLDGFEHALAAHREAEYDNYRKGFELIYKQLLESVTKLVLRPAMVRVAVHPTPASKEAVN